MKIWKALLVIALVAPVAYRLFAGGPKHVTPAGKQIVRYMAWGYPSQLNTDRDLINAFNASQETIEVQFIMAPMHSYFDKVQLMLATETAADVTRVNPEHFRSYIGLGYFMDLEPFMQSDPEYKPDEFFQVARDVALYKGRHYGVPVLFGKSIVYYNKTLFEKAGVEDPWQRFQAKRWHWEDFLDAAKAVTKIDEQGNGIMGTSFIGDVGTVGAVVLGNGGEMISADGRKCLINSPEAVEAIEWVKDLEWKWHVAPTPSQGALSAFEFESGQLAMTPDASGESPRLRDAVRDFKWDVAPLPKGKVDTGGGYGCHVLVMAKSSKAPEAAWRFMQYMTGVQAQTLLSVKLRRCIPTRKAIAFSKEYLWADQPPFNMGTFIVEVNEPQKTVPFDERYVEWTTVLQSYLDQVFLDEKPTQQAMDEAAVKINAILAGEAD